MKKIDLPSKIPFYVLEEGESPGQITDNFAYIQTAEKLLIKRTNKFCISYTKTDKIPGLSTEEPPKNVGTFPKIPYKIIEDVEELFLYVYKRDKTEASVMLFYNHDKKDWKVVIPKQENTSGGSDYKLDNKETLSQIPAGYSLLGTIHSHAAMRAFHSGIDNNDEYNMDGIHITLGDFDGTISRSARICIGKEFTDVEYDAVVAVPKEIEEKAHWFTPFLPLIKKKAYSVTRSTGAEWNRGYSQYQLNPNLGYSEMPPSSFEVSDDNAQEEVANALLDAHFFCAPVVEDNVEDLVWFS